MEYLSSSDTYLRWLYIYVAWWRSLQMSNGFIRRGLKFYETNFGWFDFGVNLNWKTHFNWFDFDVDWNVKNKFRLIGIWLSVDSQRLTNKLDYRVCRWCYFRMYICADTPRWLSNPICADEFFLWRLADDVCRFFFCKFQARCADFILR